MNSFIKLVNPWIKNLGTYEPGRPIEEVARDLGFKDVSAISKLASNENALGPSPEALKAIRKIAPEMHRYPDGNAYYLKHAIAAKLNIKPEQLLPANGSNEIIELLGHSFLGPGTGIVMADRAFIVYKLIAATFQADIVSVPMRKYTHDLDAMLAAIRPETRIVFIANPNNPTSTMVDEKTLDHFMERVPENVIVCIDEAYAIAPEECIRLLNQVRQPFNVNAMALAAAEAALKDDKYVVRTQKAVKEGIQYFEQEFRRLSLPYVPAVVNFILVDVGNGRDVFEKMMHEGVIIRPMDGYGLPRHVRITIGTKQENKKCIKALKKVLSRATGKT